ncbi:MAG: hypothetical protein EGS41_10250 [Prevotella sp.]|nr:hypothetical protein [Prevotella sp.]
MKVLFEGIPRLFCADCAPAPCCAFEGERRSTRAKIGEEKARHRPKRRHEDRRCEKMQEEHA